MERNEKEKGITNAKEETSHSILPQASLKYLKIYLFGCG
jgi:hypothetical protein